MDSLLFKFYGTQLDSLLTDRFLDYNFYADDTQLVLSFDNSASNLGLQQHALVPKFR